MTTPGERVRQERKRQRISRVDFARRIGVSDKTMARIEADERTSLLFLAEETLGLPPSRPGAEGELDEDTVLREVSDRKFWLEAARRAIRLAEGPAEDSSTPDEITASDQPARGRLGTAPTTLTHPQEGDTVESRP